MANSASLLNSKSEFDSFLFAPVGEDKQGTVVSMITAFARLDFDPWQQAADFARLPKEAARARLAAILATLPGMASSDADPGSVATRIIALLPMKPGAAAGSSAAWPPPGQPVNLRSPRYILTIVFFLALGFGSQFVMGTILPQQAAAPTQAVPASAPVTVDKHLSAIPSTGNGRTQGNALCCGMPQR